MSKKNSKKNDGTTMSAEKKGLVQFATIKSECLENNQDLTVSPLLKTESIKELYEEGKDKVTISGYEYIKNTPFSILHIMDLEKKDIVKYAISCGAEVVCDRLFKEKQEAEDYISTPKWDIIWNVVNLLLSTIKKQENE